MALIRALPDEYTSFASSLMLLDDLKPGTINGAFRNEQITRERRSNASTGSSTSQALAVSITPPKSSPSSQRCEFCTSKFHTMDKCKRFKDAKDDAKISAPWNKSKATSSTTSSTTSGANSATTEFAGNASLCSTSPPSKSSSHSLVWNADTGAMSHMTPHRSWVRNYTPLRVPIRLADDTIVYSEGVGSVVFKPVLGGKDARAVKFSRVLHVPLLQNNLLSVLY